MNKRMKKKKGIYTKFKDKETWSLDYTIAAFVLPRLKRFKKLAIGFPLCLIVDSDGVSHYNDEDYHEYAQKEWDGILDSMIWSFEQLVDPTLEPDSDLTKYQNPEEYQSCYVAYDKKIQYGLDLFAKYFRNLWW